MMRTLFFGLTVIGILHASTVSAASLYLDPGRAELFRGDAMTVAVRLDTDEAISECINTVDVVLHYSEQIIPVDTSIGSSILSMWVEKPLIDTDNRTITFAGGIPNGYCGRVVGDPRLTNVLAEIVFRSPGLMIGGGDAGNEASLSFGPETAVYLNDGRGTKAELLTYGSLIELSRNPGTSLVDPWSETVRNDQIPPENFSVEVERIPPEHGRYYAIFHTTDKQTGVDEYQIIEEPIDQLSSFTWGRADAPWVSGRSPYELRDQSLGSTIRVKAIDKAGNETIAVYVPPQRDHSFSISPLLVYGLGIVTFASLLVTAIVLWRRRRAKRQESDLSESEIEII